MSNSIPHGKGSFFCYAMATRSVVGITVVISLLLFFACDNSVAHETSSFKHVFDINADKDFKSYKSVIASYAHKHRPKMANDFCVLGYIAADDSKMAWVLWSQGKEILLFENQLANLDLSRRKISLEKDVVENDVDLHGSTYLVTRAWVDDLATTCNQQGVKLHIEKSKKIVKR